MVASKAGTEYTQSLLKQLLQVVPPDAEAAQGGDSTDDRELMGTSLNVLGKILGAEGSQFEKVQRQLLCNEMGASSVVLKFASCEDDDLCKGALQLAIALMEGGNAPVQASLLQLMNSHEAAIMPADGSKGSFLSAMCRTQAFKPPQQETLAAIPSAPLAEASVRRLACLQPTDRPIESLLQQETAHPTRRQGD